MNQREHYRIEYPVPERPRFQWGRHTLDVVDLSERGLRLTRPWGTMPVVRDIWVGELRIRWEEPFTVEGEIVRVEVETVALHLRAPGVPLPIVVREQQRLHRNYCG